MNMTRTSAAELLRDAFGIDATHNLIAGQWHPAAGGATLPMDNPSTGETMGQLARGQAADVDQAVAAACVARDAEWSRLDAAERGRVLMAMSQKVLEYAEVLARIEALDVGKPLRQAMADAKALARYFEFYAGAADKLTGITVPYREGYTVFCEHEPYGVVGSIIPWNYPMQIIGRSVGGALAAGNCCVTKPSENASASTLAVAAIAHSAGLPAGVWNVVCGLGSEAGAALTVNPGVDYFSFTGSVATGRRIQEAAARNVKPLALELGGKSPHVVFDDCDLDRAMPTLVATCMQNGGQTCSAASRVLVQRGLYEEVKARMVAYYEGLVSGPALEDHDLGPIISAPQSERIAEYVARGERDLPVAARGRVSAGAPRGGHYVAAVLFSEVPPEHPLAQEEVFGPVQVLTPFDDEDEAVRYANGTRYGLVAGLWTRDGARQLRVARQLRCGQVFVNNYGAGGGIELPFGGVRDSGHGREKGFEGLREFTQLKTVAVLHEA